MTQPGAGRQISLAEFAQLLRSQELSATRQATPDQQSASAPSASAPSSPPPPPLPPLGENDVVVNLSLFNVTYDEEYPADARWCMFRGGLPYYAPAGWRRIGVHVPGFEERFSDWPVAYHGTDAANVLSLLQHGLLNPGRRTSDGRLVDSKHGKAYVDRQTGQIPIYTSPSIEYAALYSRPLELGPGRYAKVVLQLRVRPDAFRVKPFTVQAWPHDVQLDDFFENAKIEWLFDSPEDVLIYGIMIRMYDEHPNVTLGRRLALARQQQSELNYKWLWFNGREYVPYR
jgi:hypothetical protein